MHAVAKVEPGSTFAMGRCDSLRQPATGVSPVAKLVAAIFHSINRALGSIKDRIRTGRDVALCKSVRYSALRAHSIGLIRIRRSPSLSDETFDWAQLSPDESSEFIQVIRKKYG